MLWLVWLHALALFGLALGTGNGLEHSLLESLVRVPRALAAGTRRLVSPAQLIPLAEETGLIVPIGRWVLEEACRQAHAWRLRTPAAPPLVMNVNLSSRQFQHPRLVEDVAAALRATGLPAGLLKLETTESAAMRPATGPSTPCRRSRDWACSWRSTTSGPATPR